MQPISSFILKATSVCNLDCEYCYMFNLGDRTFETKPRKMALETVVAAADCISSYGRRQGLERMTIVIHGGEPLMAGREWFVHCVEAFREAGGADIDYAFMTQTNGVLVDRDWIDLFSALGIGVSLSMDGPPQVHDRARVYPNGRGSYAETVRGLRLLLDGDSRGRNIFGGVLCVIDPNDDGPSVYRHFRALGVRRMDFLLPLEHNWDNPPPRVPGLSETPYADYLIGIFDEWFAEGDPTILLRYFFDAMKLFFGANQHVDSLGLADTSLATIDTDGSIEPLDALRACRPGVRDTALSVFSSPVEDLASEADYAAGVGGLAARSPTCRACDFVQVCGGGYLPNRYGRGRGFANPSIYCRDLAKLFSHMAARIEEDGTVLPFRSFGAADGRGHPCPKTVAAQTAPHPADPSRRATA